MYDQDAEDAAYWEEAAAFHSEQYAAEQSVASALSNPYSRELVAAARTALKLLSPNSDAATVLRMALRPVGV